MNLSSDVFNATTLELIHSITVSSILLNRLAELYNSVEVSKSIHAHIYTYSVHVYAIHACIFSVCICDM